MRMLTLISLLAWLLSACGSVTVKVGKKERPRPEFQPTSVEEQNQDGLDRSLVDLKTVFERFAEENQDKARVVVEESKAGLRSKLRRSVRELQKAIAKAAENSKTLSMQATNGESVFLELDESFSIDQSRLINSVESLAFSLPFRVEDKSPPVALEPIDDVLGVLLFDFGLYVKGGFHRARYTDDQFGELEETVARLRWRIIPEVSDAIDVPVENCLDMQIRLRKFDSGSFHFELHLRSGADLWTSDEIQESYDAIRLVSTYRSPPVQSSIGQYLSQFEFSYTSEQLRNRRIVRKQAYLVRLDWPMETPLKTVKALIRSSNQDGEVSRLEYELDWSELGSVGDWVDDVRQKAEL